MCARYQICVSYIAFTDGLHYLQIYTRAFLCDLIKTKKGSLVPSKNVPENVLEGERR